MKRLIAFLILIVIASGCQNITSEDIENAKKAIETGNPSYCENIGDVLGKDTCFSAVANKKGDATICKRISDLRMVDGCYLGVATTTRNPRVCEMMNRSKDQEECKQMASNVGKEALANLAG
ncbi:MAG: hypothetical protein V1921_06780 [Candidatus Altiarchaeota archaeon]